MKTDKSRIIAVIPARFRSTRLPGKPLADICGKPMIQWVYQSVCGAKGVDRVIVATDNTQIFESVKSFGGEAMMTPESLLSGTDRVAAVADQTDADVYVNVQGDEPLMESHTIEAALSLVTQGHFEMASAMTPLLSNSELENRSVVKALADKEGRALYFSRFPIPYSRQPASGPFSCYRHLGLYVYRRSTLFKIRSLPLSPLEVGECLEQLRALENGISIGLAKVDSVSVGVDTPEDLEVVRERMRNAL